DRPLCARSRHLGPLRRGRALRLSPDRPRSGNAVRPGQAPPLVHDGQPALLGLRGRRDRGRRGRRSDRPALRPFRVALGRAGRDGGRALARRARTLGGGHRCRGARGRVVRDRGPHRGPGRPLRPPPLRPRGRHRRVERRRQFGRDRRPARRRRAGRRRAPVAGRAPARPARAAPAPGRVPGRRDPLARSSDADPGSVDRSSAAPLLARVRGDVPGLRRGVVRGLLGRRLPRDRGRPAGGDGGHGHGRLLRGHGARPLRRRTLGAPAGRPRSPPRGDRGGARGLPALLVGAVARRFPRGAVRRRGRHRQLLPAHHRPGDRARRRYAGPGHCPHRERGRGGGAGGAARRRGDLGHDRHALGNRRGAGAPDRRAGGGDGRPPRGPSRRWL
ncbi:MAG: hypothetical protein AVDCRST_MAG19-181, partial [uncultured Thermomicrobiales bacterium]